MNSFIPVVLVNILAYFNSLITDYVKLHYRFYYGSYVLWPFVWAVISILILLLIVSWNKKEVSLLNGVSLLIGLILLILPAIGYVIGTGFFNQLMPHFSRGLNAVSMPVVGIFTCGYIYLIAKNFNRR